MESVYLAPGELDPPTYERIQHHEVEPYCKKCKAKLTVHRVKGEASGAITSVRCPTDPKHFMTTYRVAMPELDAIVRRRSLEPDDE